MVVNPYVFASETPAENTGLAPFGSATIPQIWTDNDDRRDSYLSELGMAAATRGLVILRGGSVTTSIEPYNVYITSANADEFGTDAALERANALLSGLSASAIPTVSAVYKGHLVKPGDNLIDSTTPLNMPSATALVAAANAHATPSNPLIIVCGGQLTIAADAYLQDPTIADKVVVALAGGSPLAAMGFNVWADGWAAHIVYSRLTIVTFPHYDAGGVSDYLVRSPQVPKAQILTDFPTSYLTGYIYNKAHPTAGLPGNICVDSTPLTGVLDRLNVVTGVTRFAVTGLTTYTEGVTVHDAPALGVNASGNVWIVTGYSQAASTDAWWEAWELAAWTNGETYAFNPVATDNFDRANAANLDAVPGWAVVGTIARNKITSNQAGRDVSGSGVDKRTDAHSNDHYAQTKVVTPASGDYPGIHTRLTHTGNSNNGYMLVVNQATSGLLERHTAGAGSNLLTLAVASAGQTIRLASKGDVISVWYSSADTTHPLYANGFKLMGSYRDATYATGVPGIWNYITGTGYIDDWESGNIIAP